MNEQKTGNVDDRVEAALSALGVPYDVIEIDPAYADTAAFCEKYGYLPEESANTIIVASRREPKQFCACVVLANTRLDVNRAVRKLMGIRRLSFASAEDTAALTGMEIGGVTPFNLPEGLAVYVDSRIMQTEFVILGGGGRSTKVKIAPAVFERLPSARVVDGLAIDWPQA